MPLDAEAPSPDALQAAFQALTWRPPTLRTERLLLRPLDAGDAGGHWRLARLPEVADRVGWARQATLADARRWLGTSVLACYRKRWPHPLGIVRPEAPTELLGTVGLFWVDPTHRTMELGYALHPDHWGQGIAAEASRALLDWAFAHEAVWRVQCCWRWDHAASASVARKLGFRLEGLRRDGWRKEGLVGGLWVSALLRPEWPGAPTEMPQGMGQDPT